MKSIFAVLILAAAVTSVPAQMTPHEPPTPAQMAQHEVRHYTSMLSLTTAQQEEATTIFTAAAASESSLREQQHTAREALKTSITSGDTAAITQAANTLGQLEAEMTSTHALAEVKLYKLLTPEQQTSFAAAMSHPMMEHGRGGPPPE